MKKYYENPVMALSLLNDEDVIATSTFEHRASGAGDIADWNRM